MAFPRSFRYFGCDLRFRRGCAAFRNPVLCCQYTKKAKFRQYASGFLRKKKRIIEKMEKERKAPDYFVYIALCADGTLYTGCAVDVAKRIEAHNEGKGAKYTKPRRPVRAVYAELCASKGEALRREAQIKGFRREKKLKLIADAGVSTAKYRQNRKFLS
jgi:putative endonuclease